MLTRLKYFFYGVNNAHRMRINYSFLYLVGTEKIILSGKKGSEIKLMQPSKNLREREILFEKDEQ